MQLTHLLVRYRRTVVDQIFLNRRRVRSYFTGITGIRPWWLYDRPTLRQTDMGEKFRYAPCTYALV